MNQADTGKFIAACRREKGLTQAQLAEKLNITDRAVSKWETGKSMPDSSIMLELCRILEISVNELLNGGRIEIEHRAGKAEEILIEMKKKEENNIHKNILITILFTVTMMVGIMVCCICDYATRGTFTWSLIVLSAVLFAWILSLPIILLGKRGIGCCLLSLSIFIFPFLYLIGFLIKNPYVFRRGAVLSVLALIYIWVIYGLYLYLKNKILRATGIAFFLAIPFTLSVNITLSRMTGEPIFDIWDLLSAFILLVIAFACMIGDYVGIFLKKGV